MAMKERQSTGFGTVAPQARTISTSEDTAEISLLFPVPIIIIMITKYSSIIHYNCEGFPHSMTENTFNGENDIILCALLVLLDRFQKEDLLFSAQCIWWLESIIQYA